MCLKDKPFFIDSIFSPNFLNSGNNMYQNLSISVIQIITPLAMYANSYTVEL